MVFRVVENHEVDRICDFYDLPLEENIQGLYEKAVILHLASKHKPWKKETPILTEWYQKYYALSPYGEEPLEIGERVAPLLKVRSIPETVDSKSSLVICKNDYQLFQTIRFFQVHKEVWVDIMLTSYLKEYQERVINTGLFRNVYVMDLQDSDLDEQGKIQEECVADYAILNECYGTMYYYNIDDIYSHVFYYQVKRDMVPKVICLDGGVESYAHNLVKPEGKGYGCNIFDYIEKWYSDDCKVMNKGARREYVYPMPKCNYLEESMFKDVFGAINISKTVILEWSKKDITHQEYLIYKYIIEMLKDDILVVTTCTRLRNLCEKMDVECLESLCIPSVEVMFHESELTVFTDNIINEYQLLWNQYNNVKFVDLSELLLSRKRDKSVVDEWFAQYKNYHFIKEWRQLEALLDVM